MKFGLICKKGNLCLRDESVRCPCFRSLKLLWKWSNLYLPGGPLGPSCQVLLKTFRFKAGQGMLFAWQLCFIFVWLQFTLISEGEGGGAKYSLLCVWKAWTSMWRRLEVKEGLLTPRPQKGGLDKGKLSLHQQQWPTGLWGLLRTTGISGLCWGRAWESLWTGGSTLLTWSLV